MNHLGRAPDTGWVPVSVCGDPCVPPASRSTRSRMLVRGAALAAVLAAASASALLLPLLSAPAQARWLQATCRAVLRAAGVEVRVTGARRFGEGGVLVVANHLSWIEVLALSTLHPVRLVAKQEVRNWFLVGAIATATGTLFIDRRGLRGLPRTVADVATALRAGHAVAVFPEGTTWCGAAAGPFRRAAFQGAIDASAPVRPVAVRLLSDGRAAPDAALVGEQSLLTSVVRVLRLPALVCELTLLPTIPPTGSRAELASRASTAIASTTGIPHPSPRRATTAPRRHARGGSRRVRSAHPRPRPAALTEGTARPPKDDGCGAPPSRTLSR